MQQERLKFQVWWDFCISLTGTLFWLLFLVYIYRAFFRGGDWFGLGFGLCVCILIIYLFLDWFGDHGSPSLVLTSFLHGIDEFEKTNLVRLNGTGLIIQGRQYKFKVVIYHHKSLIFINNQLFKIYHTME